MQRPTPMPVDSAKVPMAMKGFDRWVCWRWVWNGKKFDKPPLNVRTGTHASSTKSETWASFDEVYQAHAAGKFDGIGFTLGSAGASGVHFSGMDIDHCIEDGKLRPDAVYLASLIDSYTEISPSGNGVKIFTCGPLLGEGRKKDDTLGIEFYDSGRYFTVTGNRLEGFPTEVEYRSEQLSQLRQTILAPPLRDRVSELSERELALSCLAGMAAARADGYDSWLRVGMALFTVAEDLLSAWDDWSRASSKYTPGICEKKWRTFKKGGINLGSLIHWAKEDGWQFPEPKPPKAKIKKHETNGTHEKDDPVSQPRFDPELNGKHDDDGKSDDDPSMGNGLTETDNAGPWRLRIEMSEPRRYWLRSPIWENSLDLKRREGYILLTEAQLYNWSQIRRTATVQTGCYVMPDKSKKPVWDGRGGPRLLRRLMHVAIRTLSPPDFDRILSAAEWIIDCARKNGVVTDDKRDNLIGLRSALTFDDGTVIFKIRNLSATAKKESVGFTLEDLRDAADKYGEEYWPTAAGKRHRYSKFSPQSVKAIENELIRSGKLECV